MTDEPKANPAQAAQEGLRTPLEWKPDQGAPYELRIAEALERLAALQAESLQAQRLAAANLQALRRDLGPGGKASVNLAALILKGADWIAAAHDGSQHYTDSELVAHASCIDSDVEESLG